MKEIQSIHKTFNECVDDITELETKRKDVVAKPPKGEAGRPIEMFTRGYGETAAEIERLELIKKMTVQASGAGAMRGRR